MSQSVARLRGRLAICGIAPDVASGRAFARRSLIGATGATPARINMRQPCRARGEATPAFAFLSPDIRHLQEELARQASVANCTVLPGQPSRTAGQGLRRSPEGRAAERPR